MDLLYAVILGFVQGATEFLPISSSGHLVLAEHFLRVEEAGLMFDVALHVGTLIAVVTYFRSDLWAIIKAVFNRTEHDEQTVHNRKLFLYICIATVPGVLAGLFLGEFAEIYLRNPLTVAFLLASVGLLLIFGERTGGKNRNFSTLSLRDALIIGLSQAFAIMPGVSRSGITITSGLFLNLDRQSATRFSFLLSTPIILGAAVYHIPDFLSQGMNADQSAFFLTGILSACISGYLFIALLMKYIQKRTFAIFAYYRFILAGIVVLAVYF